MSDGPKFDALKADLQILKARVDAADTAALVAETHARVFKEGTESEQKRHSRRHRSSARSSDSEDHEFSRPTRSGYRQRGGMYSDEGPGSGSSASYFGNGSGFVVAGSGIARLIGSFTVRPGEGGVLDLSDNEGMYGHRINSRYG